MYDNAQLDAAKKHFENTGILSLQNVLSQEIFGAIVVEIEKLSFSPEISVLTHKYSTAKVQAIPELDAIVEKITGKNPAWKAYSISWKDYSLLSDDATEEGTHVFFELSNIPENAGGKTHFVADEMFHIPADANTLTFVQADGMKSFIQYANHYMTKRIFLKAIL